MDELPHDFSLLDGGSMGLTECHSSLSLIPVPCGAKIPFCEFICQNPPPTLSRDKYCSRQPCNPISNNFTDHKTLTYPFLLNRTTQSITTHSLTMHYGG